MLDVPGREVNRWGEENGSGVRPHLGSSSFFAQDTPSAYHGESAYIGCNYENVVVHELIDERLKTVIYPWDKSQQNDR
jgi:hypothetical protein